MIVIWKTHSNESISQCHIVCSPDRSEKLSEETSLKKKHCIYRK